MNLYLISQSVNNNYDTYDSAIVTASTEEEARSIHPDGQAGSPVKLDKPSTDPPDWDAPDWQEWWNQERRLMMWAEQKNITVQLIGTASESVKPGVILASFNAG